jgi:hypothetical protein
MMDRANARTSFACPTIATMLSRQCTAHLVRCEGVEVITTGRRALAFRMYPSPSRRRNACRTVIRLTWYRSESSASEGREAPTFHECWWRASRKAPKTARYSGCVVSLAYLIAPAPG